MSTAAELPPPAGPVRVESITLSTQGGRERDQHLSIEVALLDDSDNPVAGAAVTLSLKLEGKGIGSATGTRAEDGTVTLSVTNAPSGFYEAEVTNVTGVAWDGFHAFGSFLKE